MAEVQSSEKSTTKPVAVFTLADLVRLRDERPFRPFSIRTTDGGEGLVEHPGALSWYHDQVRFVIHVNRAGDWAYIPLAHIARLEKSEPSEPGPVARRQGLGSLRLPSPKPPSFNRVATKVCYTLAAWTRQLGRVNNGPMVRILNQIARREILASAAVQSVFV
jgi:hypothetical protein